MRALSALPCAGRTKAGRRRCAAAVVIAATVLLAGSNLMAQSRHLPPPADGVRADAAAQPLVVRLPDTRTTQPAAARFPAVQASAIDYPLGEIPAPPEGIGPGAADSAGGMTLDEVTQIALANSPVIREARNRAIAANGKALQASLYPNPTLGTASPQLAGSETQYNAYVAQDLVTKGKIKLDTAAAQRAAAQAEMQLVRARFDVLTMVRQRFYTALAMQQRVEILDRMVRIAATAHDVGQRLLQAEIGTRGDVLLLQIELSKAQAELRNAHTLAETSRRQLAAATGIYELQIDRVHADLKQALPAYEVMAVERGVVERNALMARAQFGVSRSQFVLRRAQVEPFPNVNFMGGYQNQLTGIDTPENQGIYQVQMVIPLWNRNQGNIRAAQAEVGASIAEVGRVRNELANDAAAALGRYLTARQLVERYENEILPNANEVQSINQRLYEQGQIEFLRYLAAQTALLNASLSYVDAQEVRWTAAAEVAGLLQAPQFP